MEPDNSWVGIVLSDVGCLAASLTNAVDICSPQLWQPKMSSHIPRYPLRVWADLLLENHLMKEREYSFNSLPVEVDYNSISSTSLSMETAQRIN